MPRHIIRTTEADGRSIEYAPQRALVSFPKWDGKLVLAGIFILGYYSLVLVMAWRPLPAENAGLVRDALLTLGPPIGIIFGALFRTTGAEERAQALRSEVLQTAITTPSVVPALTDQRDLEADVRAGAREGSREGVAEGLSEETPPPREGE